MALSRTDLALPETPREEVDLPELGGGVLVRGLLLRERLALFAALRDDGTSYASMGQVLAACVVQPDGTPLLTEAEWERFGGAHFAAALRVFAVAKRLSGLDVEDVEKN
jgi:hypothetical protein